MTTVLAGSDSFNSPEATNSRSAIPDSGSGSVAYREAGEVMRATFERAAATRIPSASGCGSRPLNGTEFRVLTAIVGLTAGYSKLSDSVNHGELARLSNINGRELDRALRTLATAGLIQYRPGHARDRSIVALIPVSEPASQSPPPAGQSAPLHREVWF